MARGSLVNGQAEPARQIGAPHVFPRMGRGDIRRAYTLGRELGKGGGGVVRECLDPLTGQPVAACKTIPKTKLQRPDLVEELRAEVAAMKRLSGHAHVVRLLAVYEDDDAVHVVMELCTGGDLYDLLTAATTLPEPIAAQLASQILKALSHSHRNGILHRDIKPENILLANPVTVQDGQVTLIEADAPATGTDTKSGGGTVATVPTSGGAAEEVIMQDVITEGGSASSTVACAGGGYSASPSPSTSTFSTSVVSSTPSSTIMSLGSASTASSRGGGGHGAGSGGEEEAEDRAEGVGSTLRIKLADFGLSVVLKTGQQAVGMHGSNVYMAPEVVCRKPYGLAIDLWGLGVILFTALSGYMPFWGNSDEELFVRILRGRPDYVSDPWPSISAEAKDLVHRLLTIDPPRRISADVALQHPWILKHCSPSAPSIPLSLSEPATVYPNNPAGSNLNPAAAAAAAAAAAMPPPASRAAAVAAATVPSGLPSAAPAAAPAAAGAAPPPAAVSATARRLPSPVRRQPSPIRRAPSPAKRPASPATRATATATAAAGAAASGAAAFGAAVKASATSPRYPSKTRPATAQVAAARASAAAATRAAARGAAAAGAHSVKVPGTPTTPLLPSRTRANVPSAKGTAGAAANGAGGKRVGAEDVHMHVDTYSHKLKQQQQQQQQQQKQEQQQRQNHRPSSSPAHSPTISSASSAASCPTPFTLPHSAALPSPHPSLAPPPSSGPASMATSTSFSHAPLSQSACPPAQSAAPTLIVLPAAATARLASGNAVPTTHSTAGVLASSPISSAPIPAAITIRPSSVKPMPPPSQLAPAAASITASATGWEPASAAATAPAPSMPAVGGGSMGAIAADSAEQAAAAVLQCHSHSPVPPSAGPYYPGSFAAEAARAPAVGVPVAGTHAATAEPSPAPPSVPHMSVHNPSPAALPAAAAAAAASLSHQPTSHEPTSACPADAADAEGPIEPLMRASRARKNRTGVFRVTSSRRREAHAPPAAAPCAATAAGAGVGAGAGASNAATSGSFGSAGGAMASATSKLASLFSLGAAPAAKARKNAAGSGVSGSGVPGSGASGSASTTFFRARPSGLSSPFTFFSPKRKIRKSQVVVNSAAAAAGTAAGSCGGTDMAVDGSGGQEEEEEEEEEEVEEGEFEAGEEQEKAQLEAAGSLSGYNSAVLSAAAAAVLQTHSNQQEGDQPQQQNRHPHAHQPWQRHGMIGGVGSTGAASNVGTIAEFRARLSPAVTLDRTAAPEPVAVYSSTGNVLPAVRTGFGEKGTGVIGKAKVTSRSVRMEVDGGACEGGLSDVVSAFSILRTDSIRGPSGAIHQGR
ncbi:hypothetical protein CLOM_g18719 [Closterium sp. NIES-68]|nr:hypothetical protein CLOM_g18719 [Closterium sp. NIES-68]GJP74740.1 hypothetical protein CLOP_g5281 [Closterium sp. NIES-67]